MLGTKYDLDSRNFGKLDARVSRDTFESPTRLESIRNFPIPCHIPSSDPTTLFSSSNFRGDSRSTSRSRDARLKKNFAATHQHRHFGDLSDSRFDVVASQLAQQKYLANLVISQNHIVHAAINIINIKPNPTNYIPFAYQPIYTSTSIASTAAYRQMSPKNINRVALNICEFRYRAVLMANSHVPRREISHSLPFVQGNCVPSGASVTLARRKYNIIEVSIAGLSLSLFLSAWLGARRTMGRRGERRDRGSREGKKAGRRAIGKGEDNAREP